MSSFSLHITSVFDQTALQPRHSCKCLANSEFEALFRTFLLCSVSLSFKHLEVCPTYLKPHSNGISYTTDPSHGTDLSRCSFWHFFCPDSKGVRWQSLKSAVHTVSIPNFFALAFKLCEMSWKYGITARRLFKTCLFCLPVS
ncbi:unnamed protein product [Ixodes persulcatus]